MNHRRAVLTLPALVTGLLLAGCAAPQPVSTASLLAEMTDLAGAAEFPRPAFTCRQFSSYDRQSTSAQEQDTWFANRDVDQYLRTEQRAERTEYVMMDTEGPGAIVRIWSANPKGTLRIYLDRSDSPALEASMADLLGGRVDGFPEPLAGQRSRGHNLYFPIPYAEHCKVTSDEGGFYYHVNYRTYPPGTRVVSFDATALNELAGPIMRAAAGLMLPGGAGGTAPTDERAAPRAEPQFKTPGEALRAGQEVTLWHAEGRPAAIIAWRCRVDAENHDLALRQLLLTIEFDDETTVVCPLGDFFGGGPGPGAYRSLPLSVAGDGTMSCRWVMPFKSVSHATLRNLGAQEVTVQWDHALSEHRWTGRTMHFHADWRVGRDVPTRPFLDWNYVTIEGQGVFVGAAFAIANPVRAWWGEGDEKIYVDGEEFPSHFGTGTEDYYGYAWCSNETFEHAYHNQPRCDGPWNYGRCAVNRWHVLDRIPFARSFEFDMELWHWAETIEVPEMSVVTYWYGRPGATADTRPPTADDLRVTNVPPYEPLRVAGVLEGEDLPIVAQTGLLEAQTIWGCSNDQHLWWRDAQPSDRLVLTFSAAQPGAYNVYGRFVEARDYGIVQIYVNDQKAGEPLDFYNERVVVAEELRLGTFDLKAGSNRLRVEIVGANEAAVKSYVFGLDYIRLESAE